MGHILQQGRVMVYISRDICLLLMFCFYSKRDFDSVSCMSVCVGSMVEHRQHAITSPAISVCIKVYCACNPLIVATYIARYIKHFD